MSTPVLPPHLRGVGVTRAPALAKLATAKALNNTARRSGKLPSRVPNLYTGINNTANTNNSIYNAAFLNKRRRKTRRSKKTCKNNRK